MPMVDGDLICDVRVLRQDPQHRAVPATTQYRQPLAAEVVVTIISRSAFVRPPVSFSMSAS